MNDKEIAELRRRFRPDRHNITHICGCYVSQQREIISEFDQSLGLMTEDEAGKYLNLFKRTLSGPQNKNLIDITFRTQQVADSDEHRLLMALRDSALKDEEIRKQFYETVIPTVSMESNYVILLAHDVYDVPFRAKDGAQLEDDGNVFSYVVCSICPVKMTKPALRYVADESTFRNRGTDFVVSPPELGFLFPAFDGRRTNLYNALYYTHNIKESNQNFVDAVFHTEIPMPAAAQKEAFQSLLSEALQDDCRYELVEAVHDDLCERMEAHKAAKEAEPLIIMREDLGAVLESHGVSEAHVAAFNVEFDNAFGTDAMLSPRNLIETKQLELRTPDVVVHVNPERKDLIQTKTIGGKQYILISAEEGVEVNGVSIHLEAGDMATL